MKNVPSKPRLAARWQTNLKKLAGLRDLLPQRIAADDPPYDEDDERYALMLRRRERWLSR
jgi:hypothetical protein